MKYVIRIRGKMNEGFIYKIPSLKSSISEYMGMNSEQPLIFNDIESAELYAQNHEFKNYDIEVYNGWNTQWICS